MATRAEQNALNEEIRREEENAALTAKRSTRKSQGTDSGSNVKVATLGKGKSSRVVSGGLTMSHGEVSPTDFLPGNDVGSDKASKQTPDYYRNGRLTSEITTLRDGSQSTTSRWNPVPELVGERDRPLLASIRLVDTTSTDARNNGTDSQSKQNLIPEYSKFFLETVQEAHQEKVQIVETFNDFYAFFYGEKPPIYTFSGHLLNLQNYNWWNEFMYYYENFWRGTKAVGLGGKIFLTYNYQQVQGFILSVNADLNSATDKAVGFSIQMLITKRLFFNGTPSDNLIRDNLIPRTDTGLVNTNADAVAVKLTRDFLGGKTKPEVPARSTNIIADKDKASATRTVDKRLQSQPRQQVQPYKNKVRYDTTAPTRGAAGAQNFKFETLQGDTNIA